MTGGVSLRAGGGGARGSPSPLPQMLPVRCYTCNSVIAHRHAEYVARTSSGETRADALAAIGIARLCCRRMFLGYVDLTTELVDLIIAQSNYQSNAQTISVQDEVQQTVINLR